MEAITGEIPEEEVAEAICAFEGKARDEEVKPLYEKLFIQTIVNRLLVITDQCLAILTNPTTPGTLSDEELDRVRVLGGEFNNVISRLGRFSSSGFVREILLYFSHLVTWPHGICGDVNLIQISFMDNPEQKTKKISGIFRQIKDILLAQIALDAEFASMDGALSARVCSLDSIQSLLEVNAERFWKIPDGGKTTPQCVRRLDFLDEMKSAGDVDVGVWVGNGFNSQILDSLVLNWIYHQDKASKKAHWNPREKDKPMVVKMFYREGDDADADVIEIQGGDKVETDMFQSALLARAKQGWIEVDSASVESLGPAVRMVLPRGFSSDEPPSVHCLDERGVSLEVSANLSGRSLMGRIYDVQRKEWTHIYSNQPLEVIIVDDVLEWREHIAALVREVLGREVQITGCSSAPEAIAAIRREQERIRRRLVITDVHLTLTGEHNGDEVFGEVYEQQRAGRDMPIAMASGTLSDAAKKVLVESGRVCSLEKDVFLPTAKGSEERTMLEIALRQLAEGILGRLPEGRSFLDILNRVKAKISQIPTINAFIGEIKPQIDGIFTAHQVFLTGVEGYSFLRKPDLYGEAGGATSELKLHAFKNALALFIETIRGMPRVPASLVANLMRLQVYINRTYSALGDDLEGKVSVADAVEAMCGNFNVLTGGRVDYTSPDFSPQGVLVAKPFYAILTELMTNALAHSRKGSKVEVTIRKGNGEDEEVVIENEIDRSQSGILIVGNSVAGSLPESHGTGSGTGLRQVLALAESNGYSLTIKTPLRASYMVVSILDYKTTTQLEEAPEEREAVVAATPAPLPESCETPALSKIVFICHEGTPARTFDDLLKIPLPAGYSYEVIPGFDWSQPWKSVEKYRALLGEAFLCVAHVSPQYVQNLRAIVKRFPQVVLLPASMQGEVVYGWIEKAHEHKDCGVPDDENEWVPLLSALTYEDIEGGGVVHYGKCYTPEQWSAILQGAHQKAMAKMAPIPGAE